MAGLRWRNRTSLEKVMLAVLLIGGFAAVSCDITCVNTSKFIIQIFDVTMNIRFSQLPPNSFFKTGLGDGPETRVMFFMYVAPNDTSVVNVNRVVFAKTSVYDNANITFFQPTATTVPLVGVSVVY